MTIGVVVLIVKEFYTRTRIRQLACGRQNVNFSPEMSGRILHMYHLNLWR